MPLTDTQLVVLFAALAREDGLVFPLPTRLKVTARNTSPSALACACTLPGPCRSDPLSCLEL